MHQLKLSWLEPAIYGRRNTHCNGSYSCASIIVSKVDDKVASMCS